MINVSIHNIKKTTFTRLSKASCVINLEDKSHSEAYLFLKNEKTAQKLLVAAQQAVYFFQNKADK